LPKANEGKRKDLGALVSVLVAERPVAEEHSRSTVRLRPVPPTDPPFDDERADGFCSVATTQPQLPLDWGSSTLATPGAATLTAPRVSALVTGQAAAAVRTAPPGAGEAAIAVHQFVKMCVEVLNGFRPPSQLRVMAVPDLRDHLVRQLAPRPTRRRGPRTGGQVTLGQVRVCEPRPGAGEAAVVLHQAGAVWAMALRLELRDGCWLCTAAEMV